MGKASIGLGGAAMTMLGLHYAASAIPQIPPITPLILFVAFSVAGLFILTGAVYFARLGKRRLHPLDILENIQCTYWTKAKQVRIILWWCDYSNAFAFNVSCLVQFGSQVVNLTDGINLDDIHIGNSYYRGSRKRLAEFRNNDVEVKDPSQCLVTISMKLIGMWVTRKKSKEVVPQVINL